MAEPNSLDFDEELHKHEEEIRKLDEKTKLFDDAKAKKLTLETTKKALAAKQAEKEELLKGCITSKDGFDQQYKKLSDLQTSYNERFEEIKKAFDGQDDQIGFLPLVQLLFAAGISADHPIQSSWRNIATYESSGLLVDKAVNGSAAVEYPIWVSAEQQLAEVTATLPKIEKQFESFKEVADVAKRVKDLIDLRVSMEEQHAALLKHKAQALGKAVSLEAVAQDTQNLEADCKLNEKSLEVAKSHWATYWSNFHDTAGSEGGIPSDSTNKHDSQAENQTEVTALAIPKPVVYIDEDLREMLECYDQELSELLQVPILVRFRRFEQMIKLERQEHLTVMCGNHEGWAVADALILTLPPKYELCEAEYLRIYGFSHTRVLEGRKCSDFTDILDCKGPIEDYAYF